MIYCILDPDLFLSVDKAPSTLDMHISYLYSHEDILILFCDDYRAALKIQLREPNMRGRAQSIYQRFNQANPKKIHYLMIDLDLDDKSVLNLDELLINSEDKEIWLMVIGQMLHCATRTLQAEESEIIMASWEKEHVITYLDRPKKWLKQRLIWNVHPERREKALVLFTLRNWNVRWTIRFADDLPSQIDGEIGRYPFIPPIDWINCPNNEVLAVRNGRVGWVDSRNWVWAQPDPTLGVGQNHWDVQLTNGDPRSHLNINKFGGHERPGEINH